MKRLIAMIITASMLVGCGVSQDDYDNLETEYNSLKEEYDKLQTDNASLSEKVNDLEVENENLKETEANEPEEAPVETSNDNVVISETYTMPSSSDSIVFFYTPGDTEKGDVQIMYSPSKEDDEKVYIGKICYVLDLFNSALKVVMDEPYTVGVAGDDNFMFIQYPNKVFGTNRDGSSIGSDLPDWYNEYLSDPDSYSNGYDDVKSWILEIRSNISSALWEASK